MKYLIRIQLIALLTQYSLYAQTNTNEPKPSGYSDLVELFREWRAFEKAPSYKLAPDYREETFQKRRPEFEQLQNTLLSIDYSTWPVEQQVDWTIVWAEMNGYDFNDRILKPWVRDPAFYKSIWTDRSDVPAHEGPVHHGITELWTYEFPLSRSEESRLLEDLKVIPSLNTQAKINLTGNARDLWIAGIRDISTQSDDLKLIIDQPGVKENQDLHAAIEAAIASTDDLVSWLVSKSATKTGPSGIGKEAYSWYQQNVHLVPPSLLDQILL